MSDFLESIQSMRDKLLVTAIIALVAATIGNMIWAAVQSNRHIDEVTRSKGVDETQKDRITFAINLALEARRNSIENGAYIGIHHKSHTNMED